jgi:hypothetical protein
MKRGGFSQSGLDNMISAVQELTGISPGTPLRYPDQTAALQSGHFAMKSVLGSHVTRVLAGAAGLEPIRDYLASLYPRQCATPPLLVRRGG